MKVMLTIKDLIKHFDLSKRQLIYLIEKHDIYREKKDSGRYIYTERSLNEIKEIINLKNY